MPSFTKNLNLYKTDMQNDGNNLFDFDVDLNQNFDKIDGTIGNLASLTTQIKSDLVGAINETVQNKGSFPTNSPNSGNINTDGNADLLFTVGMGAGTEEVPFSYDGTNSTSGNLNSITVGAVQIKAFGYTGGNGGRQGGLVHTFATPKGSPLKFKYDYTGGGNGEMLAVVKANYEDGTSEQIFSGGKINSGAEFQSTSTTLKVVSINCSFTYGYSNTAYSEGACNITSISETITKSVSTADTVYFKIGGQYPNLKWSDIKGKQNIVEYINPMALKDLDTGVLGDGKKNVFLNSDGTTFLNLKHTISRTAPISPFKGDTWVNMSIEPLSYFKFDGVNWVEFDGVLLGSVTLFNKIIQKIETVSYNQNGYDTLNGSDGMPSGKYIDLERPPSSAAYKTYFAPASGYFAFSRVAGGIGAYVDVTVYDEDGIPLYNHSLLSTAAAQALNFLLEVPKGGSINIGNNCVGDWISWKFLWAKGAK